MDISKEAAKMWQKETLDIRKKFKKLSNIIKVLHSKRYPNYKYRPRKKNRKKRKHKKAKKNIAKICIFEDIEKNNRDKNIENSIGSELNYYLPESLPIGSSENNDEPICSMDDSTDIVLNNHLLESLLINFTENNDDSTNIELNNFLPESIPICSMDDDNPTFFYQK